MPFTAGVYYGGEMLMNHYNLILHMTTNSSNAVNHNVAFERIKHFVYQCLDSTIFIDVAQEQQCEKFIEAGLSITTVPGDPVDQLIGLMLYYKLNAIMEDRIIVDETEISSILGENMVYLHSDNEITDVEIIPEWWTSAEPVHNEYTTTETEKIVSMSSSIAWKELELAWPVEDSLSVGKTGNTVVFADFKSNNDTK
jgi:hypothetical protein